MSSSISDWYSQVRLWGMFLKLRITTVMICECAHGALHGMVCHCLRCGMLLSTATDPLLWESPLTTSVAIEIQPPSQLSWTGFVSKSGAWIIQSYTSHDLKSNNQYMKFTHNMEKTLNFKTTSCDPSLPSITNYILQRIESIKSTILLKSICFHCPSTIAINSAMEAILPFQKLLSKLQFQKQPQISNEIDSGPVWQPRELYIMTVLVKSLILKTLMPCSSICYKADMVRAITQTLERCASHLRSVQLAQMRNLLAFAWSIDEEKVINHSMWSYNQGFMA
jgi:hypothetical protein